jgi:hypothetical protein
MTASTDVNAVRLTYSDLGDGSPLFCLHGARGLTAGRYTFQEF